jgi:hypothetical protein
MRRYKTFTVDAESVQGNAGASVTFRTLKVRTVSEYNTTEMTDEDLLRQQIESWSGFEDDEGRELPSPSDEPDILGELYLPEKTTLLRLLFRGPDEDTAKN